MVAIIATGDELMKLGRPLRPGKVYNSNALALEALVKHYGGTPQMLGIARDNESSVLANLKKGLAADAIITSGGVSRGDYDLVRLVLEKVGKVVFSRVKMAPGASFAFGLAHRSGGDEKVDSVPVFALSGPPSGCIINFETFVRPALFKMRGFADLNHPVVEAIAEDSVSGRKSMTTIKWTHLNKVEGKYRVQLNAAGGLLVSMANANSLAVIPEGTEIGIGDKVSVWPLDWSQCP